MQNPYKMKLISRRSKEHHDQGHASFYERVRPILFKNSTCKRIRKTLLLLEYSGEFPKFPADKGRSVSPRIVITMNENISSQKSPLIITQTSTKQQTVKRHSHSNSDLKLQHHGKGFLSVSKFTHDFNKNMKSKECTPAMFNKIVVTQKKLQRDGDVFGRSYSFHRKAFFGKDSNLKKDLGKISLFGCKKMSENEEEEEEYDPRDPFNLLDTQLDTPPDFKFFLVITPIAQQRKNQMRKAIKYMRAYARDFKSLRQNEKKTVKKGNSSDLLRAKRKKNTIDFLPSKQFLESVRNVAHNIGTSDVPKISEKKPQPPNALITEPIPTRPRKQQDKKLIKKKKHSGRSPKPRLPGIAETAPQRPDEQNAKRGLRRTSRYKEKEKHNRLHSK